MRKKFIHWSIWLLALNALLLGTIIFSLCVGAVNIPLNKIFEIILNGKGTSNYSILIDLRLPRIILGLAIGGALSLAGAILQGMFRNPLVEPYTLGISGGASLGVALSIVLGLNAIFGLASLPLAGFLGAGLVIILVYSLSVKRGILKIQGFLLTGVMISFISSSLIMLIMSICRIDDLHGIVFWIMGSLSEPNWQLIKSAFFISLSGLIAAYFFSLDLNAFSLGEEGARHLGINTEKSKRLLFILASLLTGTSVALTGAIGFVGLIIPHFMRMFIGRDHRILLVSSYLAGAAFLILCDTLARIIILPLELPVGVITGILGGSLFVWALNRKEITLGEK